MKRYDIFKKVVNNITREYHVNSILIVGKGAAATEEEFDALNDIDIVVVLNDRTDFQRQVENIYDVPFDISYISIYELISCIEAREPIWVNMLNHCKPFIVTDEIMAGIISRAKELWVVGPQEVTEMEKKYIRFEITQLISDLDNRMGDPVNARYLMFEIFSTLIKRFYTLKGIWLPKRKYRLQGIERADLVFYSMIMSYLETNSLEGSRELIGKMTDRLLEPIGGKLSVWEKGEFHDIKI